MIKGKLQNYKIKMKITSTIKITIMRIKNNKLNNKD